jgi:hypothetical protein
LKDIKPKTYQPQDFSSDIGLQGPDFGKKNRLDDIANQVVVRLWHALDWLRQRARMRLSREGANWCKGYIYEGSKIKIDPTHILLLLENMSNLEPDVSMSKRAWRVAKDTIKASQRVLEFALLFIYNA